MKATVSASRKLHIALTWLLLRTVILVIMVFLNSYSVALAQEKSIPRIKISPWQSLVKPDAHWLLHESAGDRNILVEAYDIQNIGTATLARLRWVRVDSEHRQSAMAPGQAGLLIERVAVTPRGLYILAPQSNSSEVADLLKNKPDYPAKLTSKQNTRQGIVFFTRVKSETESCFGFHFKKKCDTDNCYATMCVDSIKGITFVSGGYSPDASDYSLQ